MRQNFDKALKGLLLLEGVKETDIPGDHGGLTGYSGITNNEFQAYLLRHGFPSVDLFQMTPAQAADILLENYWEPGHCDDLADGLDLAHFFWCVNHGMGANRHLQAAAEAWGPDGLEDGIIGHGTLTKIQSWETLSWGYMVLIERYLGIQAAFYDYIEQHDPTQLKFLLGWKDRVIRTRDIILGRPLSC